MGPIRAIYENGVFKPTGPIDLPEGTEVTFEPRPVVPPPEPDEDYDPHFLERELAWLASRTEADQEETRRRLAARSLPPGSFAWSRPPVTPAAGSNQEAGEPSPKATERLP